MGYCSLETRIRDWNTSSLSLWRVHISPQQITETTILPVIELVNGLSCPRDETVRVLSHEREFQQSFAGKFSLDTKMHHLDARCPPCIPAEKGRVTSIGHFRHEVWPKGGRQRKTAVPVENSRVPIQRRPAKRGKIPLLDDRGVSSHRLVVRSIIQSPVPSNNGFRTGLVRKTEAWPEVPIMGIRQLPPAEATGAYASKSQCTQASTCSRVWHRRVKLGNGVMPVNGKRLHVIAKTELQS